MGTPLLEMQPLMITTDSSVIKEGEGEHEMGDFIRVEPFCG
jgi:hypothetical protein